MENTATQILTNLAFTVPQLVIYVTGALLALVRWNRHPQVSSLVLAAAALFAFGSLIAIVGMPLLVQYFVDQSSGPRAMGPAMLALRSVIVALHTIAVGMLFAAVFVGRTLRV